MSCGFSFIVPCLYFETSCLVSQCFHALSADFSLFICVLCCPFTPAPLYLNRLSCHHLPNYSPLSETPHSLFSSSFRLSPYRFPLWLSSFCCLPLFYLAATLAINFLFIKNILFHWVLTWVCILGSNLLQNVTHKQHLPLIFCLQPYISNTRFLKHPVWAGFNMLQASCSFLALNDPTKLLNRKRVISLN